MLLSAMLVLSLGVRGEVEPCVQEVKALFGSQRYGEAARRAEACWAQTQELVLLYFAAQARANAGHVSHAVVALRSYLAQLPMEAAQRGAAEALLTELLPRTVEVVLSAPAGRVWLLYSGRSDVIQLAWKGGQGVVNLEPGTWRVWSEGHDQGSATRADVSHARQSRLRIELAPPRPRLQPPSPMRGPVELRVEPWRPGAVIELRRPGGTGTRRALTQPRTTMSLEAGAWEVVVRVPGREPLRSDVKVVGLQRLTFSPGPDRVTRVGIGVGAGLGVGALGLAIGGVRAAVKGREAYAASMGAATTTGYGQQMAGIGLLGGAFGLLASGVTTGVTNGRKALLAELGIGGALLAGGAIGAAVARYTPRWGEPAQLLYPGDTAAALAFGAGVGLLGGAGIGLLSRWLAGRQGEEPRRVDAIAWRGGVALRGRF